MIKQGRMTEQGMKFFKEGLAKPTLDYGIPKNPDMPIEIKRALAKDTKAKRGFEKMPPSSKRMYYRMFLRAKMPATKEKRINEILKLARNRV